MALSRTILSTVKQHSDVGGSRVAAIFWVSYLCSSAATVTFFRNQDDSYVASDFSPHLKRNPTTSINLTANNLRAYYWVNSTRSKCFSTRGRTSDSLFESLITAGISSLVVARVFVRG